MNGEVKISGYTDSQNISYIAETDELPSGIILKSNGELYGSISEEFSNIFGIDKSSTILAKYPGADDLQITINWESKDLPQLNVTYEYSWKYYQKDEETGEYKRAADPTVLDLTSEKRQITGKATLNPETCYSINDKIFVWNSFKFEGKQNYQVQRYFDNIQNIESDETSTHIMFIENGFSLLLNTFKYVYSLSQSQINELPLNSTFNQYTDININDYSLNDMLETVTCNDNIQRKLINYQKLLALAGKTFECAYKKIEYYKNNNNTIQYLHMVDHYWEITTKLSFS